MNQLENERRQELIDEIIALEFEQLFDYQSSREEEIKELREQAQYFQPIFE